MRRSILGAGLILPPLAWFAGLEGSFAIAPLACSAHGKSLLLLISVAAFTLSLLGGVLAWTQRDFHWRLVMAGMATSLLFTMVIVAQSLPNLLLGGCE